MAILEGLLLGALCILASSPNVESVHSEGTSFVAAFPPHNYTDNVGIELVLTSKEVANVHLEGDGFTHDMILDGLNSRHNYYLTDDWRVAVPYENLALYITSDVNISVFMSSERDLGQQIPDTTLLRPYQEDHTNFFLSAWQGADDCDGSPTGLYMIAAYDDNTSFQVERKDGGGWAHIDSGTLDRFGVFTRDYSTDTDRTVDVTGYRVTSDKPVAVYAGQGCAYMSPEYQEAEAAQFPFESMPSEAELGTHYITLPIVFGVDEAGYFVRIVGTVDGTVVNAPDVGFSATLDEGEWETIDTGGIQDTSYAFEITSTEPILVTQYGKDVRFADRDDNPNGAFAIVLTPSELFGDNVYFQTPRLAWSFQIQTMVVIICERHPPLSIYYGDTDLVTETWTQVPGTSYSYHVMPIFNEYAYIWTPVKDNYFAAYFYTSDYGEDDVDKLIVSVGMNAGFGNTGPSLLTTTTTEPPPTTTRAGWPPNDDREVPWYEVVLAGNFSSVDGEEISEPCAFAYSEKLRDKAISLIPTINFRIGSAYCLNVQPGEITAITAVTTFVPEEPAKVNGTSTVEYLIEPVNYLSLNDVYQCSHDITESLSDFREWGQPILEPIEGCPVVVYIPNYFWSGQEGWDWFCGHLPQPIANEEGREEDEVEGSDHIESNPPLYSRYLHQTYIVTGGETLSAACVEDYRKEWGTSVLIMKDQVNEEIVSGSLCTGLQNMITLVTVTSTFVHPSQYVQFDATLMPLDDDITFVEVMICSDLMHDYMADIENNWWRPVIPGQPECPNVVINATFFDYTDEYWRCPAKPPTGLL